MLVLVTAITVAVGVELVDFVELVFCCLNLGNGNADCDWDLNNSGCAGTANVPIDEDSSSMMNVKDVDVVVLLLLKLILLMLLRVSWPRHLLRIRNNRLLSYTLSNVSWFLLIIINPLSNNSNKFK